MTARTLPSEARELRLLGGLSGVAAALIATTAAVTWRATGAVRVGWVAAVFGVAGAWFWLVARIARRRTVLAAALLGSSVILVSSVVVSLLPSLLGPALVALLLGAGMAFPYLPGRWADVLAACAVATGITMGAILAPTHAKGAPVGASRALLSVTIGVAMLVVWVLFRLLVARLRATLAGEQTARAEAERALRLRDVFFPRRRTSSGRRLRPSSSRARCWHERSSLRPTRRSRRRAGGSIGSAG